jgi:hypothetical protein
VTRLVVGLALGVVAGVALTRRRPPAPAAGTPCRSCTAARVQAAHWRQQADTFRTMAFGPTIPRRDN